MGAAFVRTVLLISAPYCRFVVMRATPVLQPDNFGRGQDAPENALATISAIVTSSAGFLTSSAMPHCFGLWPSQVDTDAVRADSWVTQILGIWPDRKTADTVSVR